MAKHFKDLLVWQKGMDLVDEVYKLTARLPDAGRFGLVTQMQRASVSVPCNISEGAERSSNRDFQRFLVMARGSLSELETQILICIRQNYLFQDDAKHCDDIRIGVAKMLRGLHRSLET